MLKVIEKSWTEFWAYYWRVENRHKILGIFEWDEKLVNFIEHTCELSPGNKILDLGCGGGDQATVFVRKGYEVYGIDITPSLIQHAKKKFTENNLTGTFVVADMRDIDFQNEFDLCTLLSGTFGFFDYEGDKGLLQKIFRALQTGGKVFIMFLSANRDLKRTRSWKEIDDGWELNEVWYDTESSTCRSKIMLIKKDGTIIMPKTEEGYYANEIIRCYTVPEISGMLFEVGFKNLRFYSNKELTVPPVKLQPEVVKNIAIGEKM